RCAWVLDIAKADGGEVACVVQLLPIIPRRRRSGADIIFVAPIVVPELHGPTSTVEHKHSKILHPCCTAAFIGSKIKPARNRIIVQIQYRSSTPPNPPPTLRNNLITAAGVSVATNNIPRSRCAV